MAEAREDVAGVMVIVLVGIKGVVKIEVVVALIKFIVVTVEVR